MTTRKVAVLAGLVALLLLAVPAALAGGEEPEARIKRMLREAEELQEAGKPEKAAAVRREAEALKAKQAARREAEGVPDEEKIRRLQQQTHMLMEMAHAAEEQGMPDVAEQLRGRAEKQERLLRETIEATERSRHERRAKLRGQIEELHARADKLEQAGSVEDAAELREQAARLQAEAAELAGPEALGEALNGLARRQEELQNQLQELREAIEDLRKAVRDLAERVEKAQE
ncbi:MAG: hypothetical protein AMK73_02875 [Planctomycetes bacterium SM23_32]|nr:MAG: hypothetical protein AMK73_02875 [Planctomycetes bacterium SM23_32]